MATLTKLRQVGRGKNAPAKRRQPQKRGRYTPPIPRDRRRSPKWYPFVIIGLLVAGLVLIIGNYAGIMPGGTDYWYLVGGIVAMVVGLILATTYH